MSGQVYLGIAEYRKILADRDAALARAAKAEADLESAISTSWKNLQQECARLTRERDAALARVDALVSEQDAVIDQVKGDEYERSHECFTKTALMQDCAGDGWHGCRDCACFNREYAEEAR